jgi:hypothetical protein
LLNQRCVFRCEWRVSPTVSRLNALPIDCYFHWNSPFLIFKEGLKPTDKNESLHWMRVGNRRKDSKIRSRMELHTHLENRKLGKAEPGSFLKRLIIWCVFFLI